MIALAEVEAARISSKNVKHTRFRSILYGNLRLEIKQKAPIAKFLLVKASNRHKLCLPFTPSYAVLYRQPGNLFEIFTNLLLI